VVRVHINHLAIFFCSNFEVFFLFIQNNRVSCRALGYNYIMSCFIGYKFYKKNVLGYSVRHAINKLVNIAVATSP
jgi:hypothetical protein